MNRHAPGAVGGMRTLSLASLSNTVGCSRDGIGSCHTRRQWALAQTLRAPITSPPLHASKRCYFSGHHATTSTRSTRRMFIVVTGTAPLYEQRRGLRRELCEGPLDLKAGERSARKGPPVAHSLPVYKTTHKLNHSVRWKSANLITNVVGGKDYRLRETQGEGTFDESGMYRDWLYGDERRYANYIGIVLGGLSISLFLYTMRVMGAETWDIPAPVLASQRRKHSAAAKDTGEEEHAVGSSGGSSSEKQSVPAEDALAMLKRPVIVSKAA
uniref:Uncharacterized protein n=1 Tax=Trypanosoma congolense (strain IL3000) TaxID=1068625 RepID=G0UQU0_TRYCI|nr:conserved hypothetical protein [Trypanosoma congolense IL3000]